MLVLLLRTHLGLSVLVREVTSIAMTSRFEKPLPQIIVDATPAEPAIEDAYMVVHSDIDISRGQKRLDNISASYQ